MSSDSLPSVTQVLGCFTDFSMIPSHVLSYASERGTRVHDYCAAIAKDVFVPNVEADCEGYIESFRAWKENYVEEILFVEQEFIHPIHLYVAHPDLGVLLKDGNKAVVDLKTPAILQRIWRGQCAAYLEVVRLKMRDFRKAGTLRLQPGGGPAKMDWYPENVADFAMFVCALNAYRYFR